MYDTIEYNVKLPSVPKIQEKAVLTVYYSHFKNIYIVVLIMPNDTKKLS